MYQAASRAPRRTPICPSRRWPGTASLGFTREQREPWGAPGGCRSGLSAGRALRTCRLTSWLAPNPMQAILESVLQMTRPGLPEVTYQSHTLSSWCRRLNVRSVGPQRQCSHSLCPRGPAGGQVQRAGCLPQDRGGSDGAIHCASSPPGHPVLPVHFTWAPGLGSSLGPVLWPRAPKPGGMEGDGCRCRVIEHRRSTSEPALWPSPTPRRAKGVCCDLPALTGRGHPF